MKYRSRISLLTLSFILGIFAVIILSCGSVGYLIMTLILVIPFLLVLLILRSINYTIKDGKLIVRAMGARVAEIDIAKIKKLRRSYNPLYSQGASFKMLEIVYYNMGLEKLIRISPHNEQDFIKKLQEINPRIENSVKK